MRLAQLGWPSKGGCSVEYASPEISIPGRAGDREPEERKLRPQDRIEAGLVGRKVGDQTFAILLVELLLLQDANPRATQHRRKTERGCAACGVTTFYPSTCD